jgi:hypothetical protein
MAQPVHWHVRRETYAYYERIVYEPAETRHSTGQRAGSVASALARVAVGAAVALAPVLAARLARRLPLGLPVPRHPALATFRPKLADEPPTRALP